MGNEAPTTSPVVNKIPKGENEIVFMDALQAVIDGKRITKLEWDDPKIFVELKNEKLMIFRSDEDNKYHPLTVSYGDMIGDDWVII